MEVNNKIKEYITPTVLPVEVIEEQPVLNFSTEGYDTDEGEWE